MKVTWTEALSTLTMERLYNHSELKIFDDSSRPFSDYMQTIVDDGSIAKDKIEPFIKWLINGGYFTAPASTKYHGAKPGGLFEHSVLVTQALVKYTENLDLAWERKSSPYIVGLFHDLCKIDQYVEDPTLSTLIATAYTYNEDQLIKGHGDKSVILLSQFMTLTLEEILCIRYHMGAYETEEWPKFDRAIKRYSNVLYTHTADMAVSKILER